MNNPKNIDEAIKRAREYNTPTYVMLADEVERLRAVLLQNFDEQGKSWHNSLPVYMQSALENFSEGK